MSVVGDESHNRSANHLTASMLVYPCYSQGTVVDGILAAIDLEGEGSLVLHFLYKSNNKTGQMGYTLGWTDIRQANVLNRAAYSWAMESRLQAESFAAKSSMPEYSPFNKFRQLGNAKSTLDICQEQCKSSAVTHLATLGTAPRNKI